MNQQTGGNASDYIFQPEQIENACSQIEKGAEDIGEQLSTIDGVANAISESANDWKGDDANTYIEKIKEYEKSIIELQKTYQEAAKTLREMLRVQIEQQTARRQRAEQSFMIN